MELVRECMNMREGWPLNLTKLFKGQKIGSYLLSWTLSRVFATRLCQNDIFLPELLMRWSFGICSCRCASGRDSASLSGNVAIKAFLTLTEHTLQQLHECRWNLRPAQMSKKKRKMSKVSVLNIYAKIFLKLPETIDYVSFFFLILAIWLMYSLSFLILGEIGL